MVNEKLRFRNYRWNQNIQEKKKINEDRNENQNNLLVSRQKFVTAFNMTFSSNTWSVTKQNLNMLKL